MRYTSFRISFLVGVVLFAFSCQQSSSPSDQLYDEVMYIHDEVMPKVHNVHKLSKQLKEKMEAEGLEEVQKAQIKSTLDQLDAADKAMWDWMNAFERPDASLGEEKVMALLKAEKEKISKVSEMILSSITAAEGLLQ